MFEYKVNRLLEDIIVTLLEYEKIKQVDFYRDNIEDSVVDFLIEEMIRNEYILSDLDELGNIILKRKVRDSESEIIDEKSNAIFIKSTNKEILDNYIFYDGEIRFSEHKLFFYGRFGEMIFCTSVLESYEIKDGIITFKTMNSTYTFKIIKDIDINESILLSPEKIEELREMRNALIESGAFWI